MKKIVICFITIFFFSGASPSNARELKTPDVEFAINLWAAQFTAKAKISNDDGSGDEVDFKETLGISDGNFMDLRVTWFTGDNSKLKIYYVNMAVDGDKKSNETIEFGGEEYPVGSRILTSLDIQYYRASWVWQFFHSDDNRIRFGTILEMKGFSMDAALDAPDLVTPLNEAETLKALLPAIGIAIDFDPNDMINIFGEISGLPGGEIGYIMDSDVGIKVFFHENIGVVAGYRTFKINAKSGDDYANLSIEGPYLGATAKF